MTTLTDLSRDLEELVARSAPSVVAVEHHDGQGSGVIVAGDGYVITNSHVARSPKDDRRVRLASGEELPAQLVGVGSSRVDLQACKLEYSIVSPK